MQVAEPELTTSKPPIGHPGERDRNARSTTVDGRWRFFTQRDLAGEGRASDLPELVRAQPHIRKLGFEHGTESKRPRANTWRPYRLTVDGTIAAHACIRASEAYGLTEVDAVGVRELPGTPVSELVRAVLILILTDAIATGRSMAMQFTDRTKSRRAVPDCIEAFAHDNHISLSAATGGTITPNEARQLYLAATFDDDHASRARLCDLGDRNLVSPERVCALVGRGIWSATEIRLVLSQCPFPEALLSLEAGTGPRLVVSNAQQHGMAATMTETFRRALTMHPTDPAAPTGGRVGCDVDEASGVVTVHLTRSLPSPWKTVSPSGESLPPGPLGVLARPRGRAGIHTFVDTDIATATEVRHRLSLANVLILYPADAHGLAPSDRAALNDGFTAAQLGYAIAPDTMGTLDRALQARIRAGRAIRR